MSKVCATASLRQDEHGAILVIGLAMGLVMVGALWNIVSVGDAIIWRERLQDAADAAAFESAVWNARGMNIIAFLNIVMSAAMAILVALRGIIIVTSALLSALVAADLACAVLSFVPTGITQALCAIAESAPAEIEPVQQWALRTEKAWTPRVKKIISELQNAQQVVATATPLIGVLASFESTSQQYEMLSLGLSSSLTPSSGTPKGPSSKDDARGGLPRIGRGVSLPVSLGDEWKLCEMAGRFVPNELMSLLAEAGIKNSLLDAAGGFVRNFFGKVSGSLPALFCGESSPGDVAALQEPLRAAAKDSCSNAQKKGMLTADHKDPDWDKYQPFQKYWERRDGPIVVDSKGVAEAYDFDAATCQRDELTKQNMTFEPERGYQPANVWGATQNGDVFLYSWGFSYQAPPWFERNDRGLSFVERFSTAHLAKPPDDWWKLGIAQAEMYHDCKDEWSSCSGTAMWKMRWKARLRRLHDPRDLVVRSASHLATAELIDALQKHLGKLVQYGEGKLGNYVSTKDKGDPLALIASYLRGNFYDTSLLNGDSQFGLSLFDDLADGTVGRLLQQQPLQPGDLIIH